MYKYRMVKEKILEDIKRLNPNDKIMSRPSMCKKYGYARITIDKAVNELIEENVLYSVIGSGTFVTEEYRSNTRALNQGISSWGIILPNLVSDIYPLFIRGAEDFASQYNINVVICNTDNNLEKENEYIVRLIESDVNGLIIIPSISNLADDNTTSIYSLLKEHKIPFVFCNRTLYPDFSIPLIRSNDYYGGYIATKHLIQNNYKRIAYIASIRYNVSMDRYYGYVAALMEHNIKIDRKLVCLETREEQNIDTGSGYEFAKSILAKDNPPDAFFCFNDRIALSVYRAIKECGLLVSDDIGLIGYDDTNVCETLDTKLSSVCLMNYEMGRSCAKILYNETKGKTMEGANVFIYQPKLVIRESCRGKVD